MNLCLSDKYVKYSLLGSTSNLIFYILTNSQNLCQHNTQVNLNLLNYFSFIYCDREHHSYNHIQWVYI